MLSLQQILMRLQAYWDEQGCVVLQPYDMPMGAGTFHPATALWSLGKTPRRVCYVQPCRRPSDGRYGDNPHRLQHYYQFQVLLKPSPSALLPLYLGSLKALGLEEDAHDIRLMEDDWQSPSLAAWGLGWEVWCDGMEITQLTYFQQMGGVDCAPVSLEITYGVERLALYLQQCDNVYDILWDSRGTRYGDIFLSSEREHCLYNFEEAPVQMIRQGFRDAEKNCLALLKRQEGALIYPAWEWCLQASHHFNVIEARGVLGVHERQAHIARVRHLARSCVSHWMNREEQDMKGMKDMKNMNAMGEGVATDG
ncbi:MAG: glycine--tRNA ligase subunit alpha [Alphaproteobacteria bacterium GM7ARS4]|nr:glycine--tRNA ligase subunit alpha [Alphaproteobacteria bacterium GM7ARS4]